MNTDLVEVKFTLPNHAFLALEQRTIQLGITRADAMREALYQYLGIDGAYTPATRGRPRIYNTDEQARTAIRERDRTRKAEQRLATKEALNQLRKERQP